MDQLGNRKKVLCPLENDKTGQTYWVRLGSAYVNRDGSTNVYLDALPANRRLQIRDLDERDLERMGKKKDDAAEGLPF